MIKFIFDYDKGRNLAIVQTEYLDNLREHFSVEDPIAIIKRARYGGFAATRNYIITPAGRFKLGLFSDIANHILSLGIPYKMVVTELLKGKFFSDYGIDILAELKIELRDYQELAVKKALTQGNGVIVSATASGKTLIITSLVETIRNNSPKEHKTLIVVPGIQLVEQTHSDLLEYGVDRTIISKWSGDHPHNPSSKIVVASLSILQSKKTNLKLLDEYDLLVVDEVHKFRKGNKANILLKHISTPHKYGFTGTLPENKIDEWNIIGQFGPILIKKTTKSLQNEDFITDAKVQIIRIDYRTPLIYQQRSSFLDPTARYNEELAFISKQPYRNQVISKLAHKVKNNMLILVDRIEQGEAITKSLKEFKEGKKIYFIRGSVDVEHREEMRRMMEKEDNIVCVAIASIFSTGINIKNLHYILFASAGKAKIKIIQAIGRGLRLHENKTMLLIFDISDKLEYSNKHLTKRLELYNKENIKYAIKEINE
jgi:superfamily II DNA or RNA helicase